MKLLFIIDNIPEFIDLLINLYPICNPDQAVENRLLKPLKIILSS